MTVNNTYKLFVWFSENYPDYDLKLQAVPDGIIIRIMSERPYKRYASKLNYNVDYNEKSDIFAIITTNVIRIMENLNT